MNRIEVGDCLDVMRKMPDNSVDSVVTDPPYGLSFMGKKWDYDVPSVELWAECLRVLKPGGHLLAFAGTRTQHRMAVRIEDAGFEIRDMIAWVYGSGFPKSLDVSKAIDKAAGHDRASDYEPNFKNGTFGKGMGGGKHGAQSEPPVTEAASQWQGWGTALKPALEPITVARKPLIGTVAENVLAHGTGALNIDGCRVETTENLNGGAYAKVGARSESQSLHGGTGMNVAGKTVGSEFVQPSGRWPANLIHDGSEEVLARFPVTTSGGGNKASKNEGRAIYGTFKDAPDDVRQSDTGSAARFFYCAKASRSDRGEGNNHPTVKPTDLMRYLCRLVTPPGGVVLDPFTGSGSTGKAASLEGFRFIGIELDPSYAEIAKARIGCTSAPATNRAAAASDTTVTRFASVSRLARLLK